MRIRCEFNTCKHNTNCGKEYKDIKRKGVCTCNEDIELDAFCVNSVLKEDFDGEVPGGVFDKNLNTAEGLFCNKYVFAKEKYKND